MFRHPVLAVVLLLGASFLLISGAPLTGTLVAAVVAYLIISMGMAVLGGLARPVPEPLPPGELRKVKMTFRCELCGAEVRMTVAPTEDPEPPRHCMEDMSLVTPVD